MNARSPAPETVSVLIAALGGEGGGVLAGWVTEALRAAGYLAQGTSIPGVAQRTGATTYYIEFCTAQNGFISPDRTTLIASSHRIYATSEKIHMQDGRYDAARALKAVHDLAHRAILFDMAKASEEAGTLINAILLGALSGSSALPVDPRHWEAALASGGRASAANLKGYRIGYSAATEGFVEARPTTPGPAETNALPLEAFPVETRFIVGNGLARCEDFQDRAYAEDYLARIKGVLEHDRERGGADKGWRLTRETARYLALRMTYEDVMRVADLKSRPSRAETIRNEARAGADQPVHVTEFLKPGHEEWGALSRRAPCEEPYRQWVCHFAAARQAAFSPARLMALRGRNGAECAMA
jgi:indolepyruvate ferredoxin oxidoreductase beta subunit